MLLHRTREDDLVSTFWRDLLADNHRDHRPFPEPDGVLPFAYSELKYFFWRLTVGPPDSWPVLVETADGAWHLFELTATEVPHADAPRRALPRRGRQRGCSR